MLPPERTTQSVVTEGGAIPDSDPNFSRVAPPGSLV
jgi:hypothetical protein